MSGFCFHSNPLVVFDGEPARLAGPDVASRWSLIGVDADSRLIAAGLVIGDLYRLYVCERLTFRLPEYDSERVPRPRVELQLGDLPDTKQKEVRRRLYYVRAVTDSGCGASTPSALTREIISDAARRLEDESPPSAITVYRWVRRYRCGGQKSVALASRWSRGELRRHHRQRTDRRGEEIALETIERMDPGGATGTDIHGEIARLIRLENEARPEYSQIRVPSLATVYRRIAERGEYQRAVERLGEEEANKRFRHSKAGVRTSRPLERVQVDHTPLDSFVVDGGTSLPLGRPWLTVAIDVHTDMVLGFCITFGPPSVMSVMRCLRNAFLPKGDLQARFPALKNAWPCHGLPEVLVVDNGLEFHAEALELLAQELGFRIEYGGKRRPYHKGAVERFLKSLNYNLLHKIPGTSYARFWQRVEFDPRHDALLEFDQLIEVVHRWIIDIHAMSTKRGTKSSRFERWNSGTKMYPPRLPMSAQSLAVHLSRSATRRVFHYGIQLHGDQFYQSAELQAMRRQYGEKLEVTVRYDDDDLTAIHVLHPVDQKYFRVPNREPESVRGMSSSQYEWVRKYRRETAESEGRQMSIAEAKAELRQYVNELLTSKKIRDRTKGARISGVGMTDQSRDLPAVNDVQIEEISDEPIAALPTHVAVKPTGENENELC